MTTGYKYSSVFVGGVQLSGPILSTLLKKDVGLKAVLCPTEKAASGNNDYYDTRCIVKDRPFHYFDDINDPQTVACLRQYSPDVIYVLGVSQILKSEIISMPKVGVLGGHIATLPSNRGCNPIIWAIANGLTESGVSLMWLNTGIDTGDIAAQKKFTIRPNETATEIYAKVARIYQNLLSNTLLPKFSKGIFPQHSQNNDNSNYWRRRTPKDGEIDWRMSSERIHNLVRALCPPYPYASFKYLGNSYRIFKTKPSTAKENRIPGEILAKKSNSLLVKAGEGAIWLIKHELDSLHVKVGDFL